MAAASESQENSEDANSVNDTGSEVGCNDNSKMKLKDLKVVDLRKELEKRELDKNGVKAELIERLKEAIVKEGENPEEFDFEVHDHKNNCEKNIDTVDAGENTCDKAQEDKIEEALQLSIDEEEAQLNEEGLIDIPKETVSDKIEDVTSVDNGPSTEINLVPNQNQNEGSSTITVAKTTNDDTKPKKVGKSPSKNKSTENLNSSSPKVKVIGKNEKSKGTTATSAKCLWVTGIPDNTRAADLKALFSKQGRVLAVKIVKNAKQTPSRCYGYVTMSTSKDASKAIQNLHRTELNGRVISVERAQNEPSTLLKKAESKLLTASSKKATVKKEITTPKKTAPVQAETNSESKIKEKPKEETKTPASTKASPQETGKKKEEKVSSSEKEKLKDKERKFRDHRERDVRRPIRRPPPPPLRKPRTFGYNERPYGNFGRQVGRKPFTNRIGFGSGFKPRPNLAALQKIREERYQRERFRERRELERRRLDEISRHRYIERKQREEAYRLEREKEKLRIERELLERERAEILKLEREKQRQERERLEREREELRRQAELRRSTKRPYSQVNRDNDLLWEERKKSSRYEGSASFHRESSGSSRFEYTPRERASYSREYERHPERFNSRKHVETLPPTEFNDRDARREVTIRTRDDRHVFGRSDFKDRDRSFSSRERHSSSRREPPRDDWKHDRRVHERIISSSSSGGHRRMDFY